MITELMQGKAARFASHIDLLQGSAQRRGARGSRIQHREWLKMNGAAAGSTLRHRARRHPAVRARARLEDTRDHAGHGRLGRVGHLNPTFNAPLWMPRQLIAATFVVVA